ncbi:MAG: efflux RND transporter permease subunit [Candidatus Auribacterota bacterium]
MSIARFSVRQKVLVNFAVFIIIVAGVYLYNTVPRETFPLIKTKRIQITTIDPDISSPSDVEDLITIPIEDELEDVDGLVEIISQSGEGMSRIMVKASDEVDNLDTLINDIRQKIDIVKKELPDTTEEPVIEEVKFSIPLISIGLTGTFDFFEAKKYVDMIEDDLELLDGVRDVWVSGIEDREVWIEIDPLRMASYGLTIDDISRVISRKNLNLSAGTLKTTRGEFQIRGLGEIENPFEIKKIIVKKDAQGRQVTIGDFAQVVDRFEENKMFSRVNGKRAVTLTVLKTEDADAISLSAAIKKEMKKYEKLLPESMGLIVFADTSKYIFNRIQTMESSAVMGLILVTVLLVLFLNWRMSLMTALGIPVAIFGAVVLMWLTGNTINLLTMFGLIMALGMIVDDSIVVVENVYRYIEKGYTPVQAAVYGTDEVFWPVVGSVSTTIAAFTPLVFMSGDLGKFMAFIPLMVIFALIASLFEAFFVLPSHLADFVKKTPRERKNRLLKKIIAVYAYALKLCLRHRYIFVVLCVVGIISTIWFSKKTARFILFETSYIDEIYVRVETPERNKLEDTEQVIKNIEERIIAHIPRSEYHTIESTIGSMLDKDKINYKMGSNVSMMRIDITEENPDTRSGNEIIQHMIWLLKDIPGAKSIEVTSQGGGPPEGQAVELEIAGEDFAIMQKVISEIKDKLSSIKGVQNIADNFEAGKEEYRIIIDEEKANLFGLDNTDISRSVRNTFAGLKSTEIRMGSDDVDVVIKAYEPYRKLREHIENLEVRTPSGSTVRLKAIAEILRAPGYNSIHRKNNKRIISVTADVDKDITTSAEVNMILHDQLLDVPARYPGIRLFYEGQSKDTQESLQSLGVAFIIAFLSIYMIIGAIFHSFVQPLVVVSIIPFALTGVLMGLIISGKSLGLMALLGSVALTGIVVNDSIIMVDFINKNRRENGGRWGSILRSGTLRFRPIMLTSVTTIVGLAPLIFSGGQTQILAPMAISISWGLAFGTILTLLLIPCLIAIIDDLKIAITGQWRITIDDI